jgi:hypothetical protein
LKRASYGKLEITDYKLETRSKSKTQSFKA